MPIYEYICNNCSLKFEFLVRKNGETIVCPKCKHADLKKLISNFSFSSKDSQGNVTASSSGCSSCARSSCAGCSG